MLRKTGILDMFARSPIHPLQQHMAKAQACAELLKPFFKAVLAEDWPQVIDFQAKISQLENEADEMKRDLRLHLPKSLFLPVPRGDILQLLMRQERLANAAKDIAGIVLGRRMKIPQLISVAFEQYLQRSLDAVAQANKAINELDQLLESGFRGREVAVVEKMILELDEIESDSDTLQIDLRQSLFEIEKTLEPIDVMFLYKVIEWVGSLADSAEQTGSCLQMLLAK